MALPILAAAAVSAGVSLAQLYMAEKSRGESKDRLNEIEKQFNDIVPPQYNLKVTDPPKLIEESLAAPDLPNIPNFDPSRFRPEDYQNLQNYVPELADFSREKDPTMIQETGDTRSARAAQMAALEKYTKLGEGGFDPEYQQRVQEAAREAGREAQSQNQLLTSQFQRRGLLGSGLEFAAKQSANMRGMDAMAMANQQAATDSYRNQIAALASGAELGGKIRSDDQNLQNINANIINDFNQRMSKNQQAYDMYRANSANDAQMRNQAAAQNISNMNVGQRNQAALSDRERADSILKTVYGMKNDQAMADYNHKFNERNYANSNAMTLADWQRQSVRDQNALKSQQHQDQLGKWGGQSSLMDRQNAMGTQQTQDRIAAMQGLAQAGIGAMGAYNDYQNQQKWDKRYDKMYGV